jgi:hypothetical protein
MRLAEVADAVERFARDVASGARDSRDIPPPPEGAWSGTTGPADLLARAMMIFAQGGASTHALLSWATSPDPALDGLSPVEHADRRLDAKRLLTLAWQDAARWAH